MYDFFVRFCRLEISPRQIIIICAVIVLFVALPYVRVIRIKRQMKALADSVSEISPEEFFRIRNASLGGRGKKHISSRFDFPGVYILYNNTKKMYYVGQGQNVFNRVNNHFRGHGNGDVYADYKNGDKFSIKMISLENSGCETLNELERKIIRTYGAYTRGYNRTRGNRG
jgi:hypothetical protein